MIDESRLRRMDKRISDLKAALQKGDTATAGVTSVNGQSGDIVLTYSSVGAAPASNGVTNGDAHDHSGGDGGQIDHGSLAGLEDDDHTQYHNDARGDLRYAPIAKGVTNGDAHDHSGGDGGQIALANLTDDATHRLVTDTEKNTWNGKQDALGFTPENVANKSTSPVLGTSDIQYPTQKAVKSYVDNIYANYDDPENPILRPIMTTDDMAITVGSGKDFATLHEAIYAIPMFTNHDVTVDIYSGTYNEIATLGNYIGSGKIVIRVPNGETVNINGFLLKNCICKVEISGPVAPNTGALNITNEAAVSISRCNSTRLQGIHAVTSTASSAGIYIDDSNVTITHCELKNKYRAIDANGSQVTLGALDVADNDTDIYFLSSVMKYGIGAGYETMRKYSSASIAIPFTGIAIDTDGTLAADSDSLVATQKATKTYVDARTPTGVILPYGGSSAPNGYLMCDGSPVSRTTYAALFSVIGTTYGAGDGSTTFNVPDMRGYVPVGYKSGDADFGTLGGAVGAKTHTLQVTEIPAHKHSGYYTSGYAIGGAANAMYPTSATAAPNCMTEVGGGGAHNNIQPSRIVNYIIKT
jgi:microcystin-dependent protein